MARTSHYLLFGALLFGAVACSSDSDSASDTTAAPSETSAAETTAAAATDAPTTTAAPATDAPTTTEAPTTTAAPEPLRILVTNDDGFGADGINVIVTALTTQLDNVEVTVIAPAENQSGTSDRTTEGALTVTDVSMPNGYPAKAVAGFPADTVIHALDQGGLAQAPHLVVSGINKGQNVGPAVPISGTIGAARTAAKRGIPAVASSQMEWTPADGSELELDFEATAEVVIAWIEQNYDNLLAGTMPPLVYNVNGPTCVAGEGREVVTVPVATDPAGRAYDAPSDCVTEPAGPPTDDMDALVKGYFAYSELDPNTLLPAA